MSLKIKIAFYFSLLLILGLIGQIQAAEGGSNSDVEETRESKITRIQLEKRTALKGVVSFENNAEMRCISIKFLLIFYSYILYIVRFLSVYKLQELQTEVDRFLGLSQILQLEAMVFRSCSLIQFSKAKRIADFVSLVSNLELLKELEACSKSGFTVTMNFFLRKLSLVLTILNDMVYYLMTIYLESSEQVIDLLSSFISSFYQKIFIHIKRFALELSEMKSDELKKLSMSMDPRSALFMLEFTDFNSEINERKNMEEVKLKKLEIANRLAEAGVKSSKDITSKSKNQVSDLEILEIETMSLFTLLTLYFCLSNCLFFDGRMLPVTEEIKEVLEKYIKLLAKRGTELSLDEEKVATIKSSIYIQLSMDDLRKNNPMFTLVSSRASDRKLLQNFETILSILSKCIKLIEKKWIKSGKEAHVSSISTLLKDFLRSGLEKFTTFVSALRSKRIEFRVIYESDSDDLEGNETESKGKKKHRKHTKKKENDSQTVEASERMKKESKKQAWLKHLLSREEYANIKRDTSTSSLMESSTTKSEDKALGAKVNRKEQKMKKLLEEGERSLQREEVKKTIKEQKSSNTSSRRRKQEDRKNKNEKKREEEKKLREEQKKKEKEKMERMEQSNYMYALLNSLESIEGMFKEAEKSKQNLGGLISLVFNLITNEEQESGNDVTEELTSLSISTENVGGAESQSSIRGKRRAYESPTTASGESTAQFFKSRVGAPATTRRESSPSGHSKNQRSKLGSAGTSSKANEGIMFFDGLQAPDPTNIPLADETNTKSKFLKFFSSNDGGNNSETSVNEKVSEEHCLIKDLKFSNITENSSEEEVVAALELCGKEIQRLHLDVLPSLSGRLFLELKLIEKELIRSFIRLLLIMQNKNQQS